MEQSESYAEKIVRLEERNGKLEKERVENAERELKLLDDIQKIRNKLEEKTSGNRKHTQNCRWNRTTPMQCEYRETHAYCPHTEHSCDCGGVEIKEAIDDRVGKARADAVYWMKRYHSLRQRVAFVIHLPRAEMEIDSLKEIIRGEEKEDVLTMPPQANPK